MSEYIRVAEQILAEENRPMRPSEIVDIALQRRLFPDTWSGKTPHQTMKSKLSVHVRRHGNGSLFVRTSPGKFHLRRLVAGNVYEAPAQQKPNPSESVLVFPNSEFERQRFQGVRTVWKRAHRTLLNANTSRYLDRLDAENRDDYKQVLTYIFLTRRSQVLAYKRGNYNRVADFLRGSHCIGFGGHVIKGDRDLFSQHDMGVRNCAIRELLEELTLPALDRQRLRLAKNLVPLGTLNDDSSPVGQRHFAFLFRFEVSDHSDWEKPIRGEKSITQLRWLTPNRGPIPIWDFEYWSQLCLLTFFPRLAVSTPTYRIMRKAPLRAPHFLCIIGTVGSGKSEAKNVLVNEHGYTEINSGRVLAKLMGIEPVPATPRDVFQHEAWGFIQSQGGPERLAAEMFHEAKNVTSGRVLFDGIRQRATLEALRKIASPGRVGVLFIHTLPDLAYEFYRDREATGISVYDFLHIRRHPVEVEAETLIAESDAVLYNWRGRRHYQDAIRQLMQRL